MPHDAAADYLLNRNAGFHLKEHEREQIQYFDAKADLEPAQLARFQQLLNHSRDKLLEASRKPSPTNSETPPGKRWTTPSPRC